MKGLGFRINYDPWRLDLEVLIIAFTVATAVMTPDTALQYWHHYNFK